MHFWDITTFSSIKYKYIFATALPEMKTDTQIINGQSMGSQRSERSWTHNRVPTHPLA